jgi:iron complex transport system substrate-binding protein
MVALDPDLVITYEAAAAFEQYRSLGLPAVYYSPFTESPLGSAEQLKWLSLFLNMERTANEQFAGIETQYLELSAAARAVADKPEVLIGSVSSSGTFGTGRFNPIAKHAALVADAGGVDPLASLYEAGQTFSQVALEEAVATGAEADFWYHQAYDPEASTVDEFIALNPQNASFAALEAGRTFHRFARSEDFFATGGVRADWLLQDMVSILHPDLLPGHTLRFMAPILP